MENEPVFLQVLEINSKMHQDGKSRMSSYCNCTIDEISKTGFSMRNGIAYCNNCSKPEVSSTPISGTKTEANGNAVANLFDFKFESFVSVSYFRLLYGITVVLWTIIAAVCLILTWVNASYISGGLVLLFTLGIPVVYFLLLIYTRMSIELIVNFFQIGKDIKALRESKS
jgi:uncharacterized paraquat-inducible protein A